MQSIFRLPWGSEQLATDHDSMSFEWDQNNHHLKDQILFQDLNLASDSAAASAVHHTGPFLDQTTQYEPGENTGTVAPSPDETSTQDQWRTQETATSVARSSSTIKGNRSGKWYRRWHTENAGAIFTLGGSSSESELSEVEESMDCIVPSEQTQVSSSSDSCLKYDHDGHHPGNFDAMMSFDVQDMPEDLNKDEAAMAQFIHAETPPANSKSPLSTVEEEAQIEQAELLGPSQGLLQTRFTPLPLQEGDNSSRPYITCNLSTPQNMIERQQDNLVPPDCHLQPRKIGPNRGRLPAELQLHMSDSRFDDSDSSWAEEDDQEEWYIQLQSQVASFRRQTSRISLITTNLNSSQRKQVHAMAKMMGLSHVSLGKGKLKRLLLTKCELAQTFTAMPPNKRWTSHRHHWLSGCADPRLIVVENIFWAVPESDVGSHISKSLATKYITNPLQMAIVRQEHIGAYAAYMFFKTPEDAASAVLALDNNEPEWNGWPLGAEYLRLPGSSRVIEPPLDLNRLARAAMHLWLAEQDCSDLPSYDEFAANRNGSSQLASPPIGIGSVYDQITSIDQQSFEANPMAETSFMEAVPMTRMESETSVSSEAFSSNIGQASLGANTSMTSMGSVLSDYGSEASIAKKRKRQPVTQAGYKCSNVGCDKSFDRAGDLRKHEKVHWVIKPYHCAVCGLGFLYPKDLRRHQAKKGHVQLGDELAKVPEESGLYRSLSCSAI